MMLDVGATYTRAKAQAQAKANRSCKPWVLQFMDGTWYTGRLSAHPDPLPIFQYSEVIHPEPRIEKV
jgi:hypothetical protein